MAHFLRGRLTCFYCNRGSSQRKASGLEKFQCEHCDAENYLDADGEIADPPVNTSSSARFALPIERPSSPVFDTAPNDIFCDTCLQNQQIYAQSLAEYYPTPNLSTFEEYEQAESEYKASLEERYPLICEYCEPLARKRLKDTSYAAKVDNMRRVMDRTSPDLRHLNEAGLWKLWIPFLGGFMWASSWAGQIAWDLIEITISRANTQGKPLIQQAFLGDLQQQLVLRWEMSPGFDHQVLWMARCALVLGLVSVWWNPRLKEKMRKRSGRMFGFGDYYIQQVMFLAIRGVIFFCLTSWWNVEYEQAQAAHLFLLVFSIVAIIRSYYTIQVDYTPKTLWQESPKSLLSQPPFRTPSTQDTPTTNRRRNSVPAPVTFPIECLITRPLTSLPHSDPEPLPDNTQPSFLPSEDRMDWAPTLPPSRPYTALHPPSPFKAPVSTTDPSPNRSIFSNLSPTPAPQIADPTFFPPTAASAAAETGLESIFDRAFSISHPPAEVRELRAAVVLQRRRDAERESQRRPARVAIRWRIGMLLMLGSAYALLSLADDMEAVPWMGGLQLSVQQRGTLTFGLAVLVTLREIVALGQRRVLMLVVLESVATAVLGGVVFGGEQLIADGGRHCAIGQMALAVMVLGQLLLLGRECVRVTM